MVIFKKDKKTAIFILIFFIILFIGLSVNLFRVSHQKRAILLKRQAAWQQLEEIIDKEVSKFKGLAAIVVEDLKTGWQITVNENSVIAAASIVKIPIMVSMFKAQADNLIDFNENVILKKSDIVSGSGLLKGCPAGSEFTLLELMRLMVINSDNTATNIIIKRLGFNYLNNSFKEMGLQNTKLSRLMMDFAKRSKGIENYTTASDLALVLKGLYSRRLIKAQDSDICFEILKEQVYRDRIPGKLWPEAVVANKTGLERGVLHDAGVIFTPKGDLIVCVLTKGAADAAAVKKFISDIALYAYLYLEQVY